MLPLTAPGESPMPYTPFTFEEVKSIFVMSEGNALSTGRGTGHAGGRHVDITNEGMWNRMQGTRGGNTLSAITSFIRFDDQVNAALELLNAPANDAALEQFRTDKKPGRGYPGSNSPYAEITHRLNAPIKMRYAIGGGTSTFPCSLITLVFDKCYGRPRNMHVVTCFGEFG
jgi:hypothetical protein